MIPPLVPPLAKGGREDFEIYFLSNLAEKSEAHERGHQNRRPIH
jgi:hypothetical protein